MRIDANARRRSSVPFAVLWVWVIPFLPWLADRIPLLLVLAGPIRWSFVIVALAAALGLSNRLGPLLDGLVPPRRPPDGVCGQLGAYLASGDAVGAHDSELAATSRIT
jgi:hypothetical protein